MGGPMPCGHQVGGPLRRIGIAGRQGLNPPVNLLLLNAELTVVLHLTELRLDECLVVEVVVTVEVSTEQIHVGADRGRRADAGKWFTPRSGNRSYGTATKRGGAAWRSLRGNGGSN